MAWPECEQDDRSVKCCQTFALWERRSNPRKSTLTMSSAIGLAQPGIGRRGGCRIVRTERKRFATQHGGKKEVISANSSQVVKDYVSVWLLVG